MPTPTYTPLQTITLGSAQGTVTFANIPATFRDLVLISNNLGTANSVGGIMRFNSDSTSSYSRVLMYGLGSGSGASSADSGNYADLMFPRTTVGFLSLQIMDYSATDKHKTILNRVDTADYATFAAAGRWAKTEAIHTISLTTTTGQWATGATLSLYGIAS